MTHTKFQTSIYLHQVTILKALYQPHCQVRWDTCHSSGTSQAAPHVTGAFGVLNQMWPYMKGDNLVRLVLNTANKDLPGYNVNVHGQGLARSK
jgi:hypothetical protein